MRTRPQHALSILLLVLPALAGCGRNIVRASSPSAATPPRIGKPSAPASAETAAPPIPPPDLPEPEPSTAAPAIVAGSAPAAPVAPRPKPAAPTPTAQPDPQPKPAAPQISAALKPSDQQRLVRLTTEQVAIAERNLQQSSGRQLNASQTDLRDKVNGFLSQAHEAIRDNDWVRAQNLAEKAQILSIELTKSL
jgi:hypothetical protein